MIKIIKELLEINVREFGKAWNDIKKYRNEELSKIQIEYYELGKDIEKRFEKLFEMNKD